jgi:hypothetical protein
MELKLNKYHNALIMALNSRMGHCQKELAEIAIQDDFIILESQAFASKKLQQHFSIPAYKAMKSAREKVLNGPAVVSFGYFDQAELVQMIKAVGALCAEHAELTNFLVDSLMYEIYSNKD